MSKADAVIGKWLSEEKNGVIQIYKQGDKYFGKLIWANPSKDSKGNLVKDSLNPDKKLKTRPVLGLVIMTNFEYDGDNVWDDGDIYDPESGSTYSCKMTLINNNTLDVRGYIGFSMFGRTTKWTRKLD